MFKRGLSQAVTAIIFVLLALVAVGLVWVLFKGIYDDATEDVDADVFTVKMHVVPGSVSVDAVRRSVSLVVERLPGSGDLAGYNIVLEDESGRTYPQKFTQPLEELESAEVEVSYLSSELTKIKKIILYPLFINKAGEEKTGSALDSFEVGDSLIKGFKVFVTSETYDGNLTENDKVGIEGADKKCQKLANKNANLESDSSEWKAWLSTKEEDQQPIDPSRIYPGEILADSVPYQLVNGITIANSWQDLVDGTISAPISVDEKGNSVTANENGNEILVFTHTDASGRTQYNDRDNNPDNLCDQWNSNEGSDERDKAKAGNPFKTDDTWTSEKNVDCNTLNRIYCFERPKI